MWYNPRVLPRGFFLRGVRCGIAKTRPGPDLALVYSEVPSVAAGVFTTNRVAAAPVEWSRRVAGRGMGRAVLLNAGCANACTGKAGLAAVKESARSVGRLWGIPAGQVLVASTGVIGEPLDVRRVRSGVQALHRLWRSGGSRPGQAARAIMTTDTLPKVAEAGFRSGKRKMTVWGMAKGSGMISPNLATMLSCLITDAPGKATFLKRVLRAASARTFNRVTVDGETSTNDCVFLLANGASGVTDSIRVRAGLAQAVEEVAGELSRMIARDGEGATKLVEISVEGAANAREADLAARTVANSLLVKTALYGGDPNWGRVMAALGRSGARFSPERVTVSFGSVTAVRRGRGVPRVERRLARQLAAPKVPIRIDLGGGTGSGFISTCDLSHRYVTINAHYRT